MSERGEYRSIRRVLLDGPDFQSLSAAARWVFMAVKLNVGPSGIEVAYPAALMATLAQQTGHDLSVVDDALAELELAGWVKREANIIWIVGQLNNDPHVRPTDPKHRKSIQGHVASLPRLEIVREFVKAHPDFLVKEECAAKGLAWAYEGPSKGHRRAIEAGSSSRNRRREKEKKSSAGADAPRADGWLVPSCRVWEAQFGAGSFEAVAGEAAKRLSPFLRQGQTPAQIADHLARYLSSTEAQFVSITRFAKLYAKFAPVDAGSLVDEFGVLTTKGDKETRPDGGLRIA